MTNDVTLDLADLPATLEPAAIETARAVIARQPVVLCGPPGVMSTLLARRMIDVLPPIPDAEVEPLRDTYLRAGLLADEWYPKVGGWRPFRAPHHTISEGAITGAPVRPERRNARGGLIHEAQPARPGEAELARGGVFLMDELPEWRRTVVLAVARGAREFGYSIIATTMPCPCGWRGVRDGKDCTCTKRAKDSWEGRLVSLSGLLSNAVPVVTVPPASMLVTSPRCRSTVEIVNIMKEISP